MMVYVVCCNAYDWDGELRPESWEIDSAWRTRESAAAYLNDLTGVAEIGDGEWLVDPDDERANDFDVYYIGGCRHRETTRYVTRRYAMTNDIAQRAYAAMV